MVVPYLGFLSDSSPQVFHLLQEKKDTFLNLICEVLDAKTMIKTLQRLVGKCLLFSCSWSTSFHQRNECGYFEGPCFL